MINTRQVIITITEATCGRCGHQWELKRTDADGKLLIPKNCPHCHSPYWNKPRKYNLAKSDEDESKPKTITTFMVVTQPDEEEERKRREAGLEAIRRVAAQDEEARAATAKAARASLEGSREERLKAQLAQLEAKSRKA